MEDPAVDDVSRAQRGDEAAFGRVYAHVHPRLVRYLSTLVAFEAEDVAAETWLQVCRDLDRFDGDLSDFRGWVVTIGRHRALDHLRSTRRRPVEPREPFLVDSGLWGASGPDYADAADVGEEAEATRAALELINSLPPDQAAAVMLRVVVGLDAKTAARVLDKRPGAVRMSAHRGLRALAARLKQDDV